MIDDIGPNDIIGLCLWMAAIVLLIAWPRKKE